MIYVMADIHGNEKRFDSVMEKIGLTDEDTLYVLGDVIDRYPGGVKLLQRLLDMPNAKLLLGNHEHMMLECLFRHYDPDDPWSIEEKEKNFSRWYRNGGMVTKKSMLALPRSERFKLLRTVRALPLCYDITVGEKAYKLVHAAPIEYCDEYSERYRDAETFAVWMRWGKDFVPPWDYTLIFGHTPTDHYLPDKTLRIYYGDRMIGIDCGSGYPDPPDPDEEFYGRLACLRLDDMKEFYSEEENKEPS